MATAARSPTSVLHILLLEDDALIRLSTAGMLASLGHSVTEAANGKEALERLEQGTFDVLMTDLALPDTSGEDVARRAVKQHPELRVIFATGYDTPPDATRKDGLQSTVMLKKPYDVSEIAAALQSATSPASTRD